MKDVKKMRNDLLSQRVINALKKRNMEAYYVHTKEEALEKALKLIPKGSSVSWGGATSAIEIGLLKKIKQSGNYKVYDRDDAKTPEEIRQIYLQSFDCDFFIGGINAMTEGGILVNVDGNSNRVAAYAYGPKYVLLIASMDKVVSTLDGAIERARTIASPINAQRFGLKTPCATAGSCGDCTHLECICCNIMITRFSRVDKRIKIILVNEKLGF